MVINVGNFKEGRYQDVKEEIQKIKQACGSKILKVIVETCYLTENEIG
jgi:deoxyribose-phosphate aldolase